MPALEEIVFVVDENLLRLGSGMAAVRRDTACFATGPLEELLPQGIEDTEWIPIVGDRGWVIVTNDRRIRTRPVESQLAIEHRLKVIHLHGAVGNARPWEQLTRLTARWEAVEQQLATNPDGPWWLSLRSSRAQVMRYEPGAVER